MIDKDTIEYMKIEYPLGNGFTNSPYLYKPGSKEFKGVILAFKLANDKTCDELIDLMADWGMRKDWYWIQLAQEIQGLRAVMEWFIEKEVANGRELIRLGYYGKEDKELLGDSGVDTKADELIRGYSRIAFSRECLMSGDDIYYKNGEKLTPYRQEVDAVCKIHKILNKKETK